MVFINILKQRWILSSRCMSYLIKPNQVKTRNFREITLNINKTSSNFIENVKHNKKLENNVLEALQQAEAGGGEKAIARHVERNKKWLAMDRLNSLLDEEGSLFELSTLSGLMMEYGDIPRAGLITGIGKVNNVYCMFIVNDATVKGGTIYPIAIKKQLRAQEIALQNNLPCIYVVDSGGAFLPLQAGIFADKEMGGRTFANEAILSSEDIPQVAIVVGNCTAGGAYVPTMCQEAVIVHRIGSVFLGGPPLVYAALGEVVSAEDLGGAALHCKVSGCTDHYADTEAEAFETGRDIVATFNVKIPNEPDTYECPKYQVEDILGSIPADMSKLNSYEIIAHIVDGSGFQEFKALYGRTLLTGFARIEGYLVGILANNGNITIDAAVKGSHFAQLCNQRGIPMIFLQNIDSKSEPIEDEENAINQGKKLKAEAQMMSSIACAQVAKLTVIMGNSYGAGNYIMCGRSFSPDFLFSWPQARIGLTDAESLTSSILQDLPNDLDPESDTYKKLINSIPLKTTAMYSSTRCWDDGLILPQDTRKVLGKCLRIVNQTDRLKQQRATVLRM